MLLPFHLVVLLFCINITCSQPMGYILLSEANDAVDYTVFTFVWTLFPRPLVWLLFGFLVVSKNLFGSPCSASDSTGTRTVDNCWALMKSRENSRGQLGLCELWDSITFPETLVTYCCLLLAMPTTLGSSLLSEHIPDHCQLHSVVSNQQGSPQHWWWTQVSCQHTKDSFLFQKTSQFFATTTLVIQKPYCQTNG